MICSTIDAVETPILIDAVYQGAARKLLVQANRNGYIYVLDRTNGKFLSATPFVEKLNWAKGIDAQGRPLRTGVEPTARGNPGLPRLRRSHELVCAFLQRVHAFGLFHGPGGMRNLFSSSRRLFRKVKTITRPE